MKQEEQEFLLSLLEEQENKEILIKDLTSRVPYNTIVQIKNSGIWNLKGIEQDKIDEIGYEVIVWHGKNYPSSKTSFPISICKPYLYPLSTMEELGRLEEYNHIVMGFFHGDYIPVDYIKQLLDFYHSNHLDYNGLIEKGLAIDATGKNIY